MDTAAIARRVVARTAKPYVKGPKETKEHQAEKLADKIRDVTGLSKGLSEAIADAIVRGRQVLQLALQKSWPISEDGIIEGPKGTLPLEGLAMARTASAGLPAVKQAVTDYYEKPEDIEDPAERIEAVNDISKDLDKAARKLAAEAQALYRYSESLKRLKAQIQAPAVGTPLEVGDTLKDAIKKAEASLTLVLDALDGAADQYADLSRHLDKAEQAVRDREDELMDVYHEAKQALR